MFGGVSYMLVAARRNRGKMMEDIELNEFARPACQALVR